MRDPQVGDQVRHIDDPEKLGFVYATHADTQGSLLCEVRFSGRWRGVCETYFASNLEITKSGEENQ